MAGEQRQKKERTERREASQNQTLVSATKETFWCLCCIRLLETCAGQSDADLLSAGLTSAQGAPLTGDARLERERPENLRKRQQDQDNGAAATADFFFCSYSVTSAREQSAARGRDAARLNRK